MSETKIFYSIVLTHPDDLPPYRGSSESTGVDIRASERVVIEPGRHAKVPTGCSVEIGLSIDRANDLQMRPRSGLAARGIFGHVGTIDADYRGELVGLLYNTTGEPFVIERGDRIYQLVCGLCERPWLDSTNERGEGGLGSTGVK